MSSGKLGSSSYEAGDTGGSCGDYEHGVSDAWVARRVDRASRSASASRLRKFHKKMSAGATRTGYRELSKRSNLSPRTESTAYRLQGRYLTADRVAISGINRHQANARVKAANAKWAKKSKKR